MVEVGSYKEFIEKSKGAGKYWMMLYKGSSETGDCALKSLTDTLMNMKEKPLLFTADVEKVRDIHEVYGITSVPSLLKFEEGEFKDVYKGCNDQAYYTGLFNGEMFSTGKTEGESGQKSVTVYSTPTCSWCTRLKTYLKEKNIKFRDVDVSKDQKAAEEMVKRSGQQGVPQSLIGGQVVVGFDKAKIDQLLGI